MLIAIMRDVFERETEKKEVKKIQTKREILAVHAPMLSQSSKSDKKEVYIIVV